MLVLVVFTAMPTGDFTLYQTVGFTAVAAASFGVMAVLVSRGTGVLAQPPLMAVGRISYGLYLWHFPFVMMAQGALYSESGGFLTPTPGQLDDVVITAAAVGATFTAAILSWFLVERRFLHPGSAR